MPAESTKASFNVCQKAFSNSTYQKQHILTYRNTPAKNLASNPREHPKLVTIEVESTSFTGSAKFVERPGRIRHIKLEILKSRCPVSMCNP